MFTSPRPSILKSGPHSISHIHRLGLEPMSTVSSPGLPSPTFDQIQTGRRPADESREQVGTDLIPLLGSARLADRHVSQLPTQEYPWDDETTIQAIETFSKPVNKFASRLKGPVSGDLASLQKYQQDSLVIMRMAIREVVRSLEEKLGLGRREINDEDDIQTWSNGMLALFDMVVEALYCRIKELKFLLEEQGEVVEGIVDGMMVLAPGLLQFEATAERSDNVEGMLGEAKVIHKELMNFRKVRDRLSEVIDQWYEGSTWIDSREDSGIETDGTASHDISEDVIISQEATDDYCRELPDLPTSIHDSDLSPTQNEVSSSKDFVKALDIALRQHCIYEGTAETDAGLSESEMVDIRLKEDDESSDLDQEIHWNADIIWARKEEQFQAAIKHDEISAYNDDIIEKVNFHQWLVRDRGETRDFIEDVEYHKNEIRNLEDAMDIQRRYELEEILFWESDVGRDLMADLELDGYLMSISEEAIDHQREFDLERFVVEEAAFWEEGARLERMKGAHSQSM